MQRRESLVPRPRPFPPGVALDPTSTAASKEDVTAIRQRRNQRGRITADDRSGLGLAHEYNVPCCFVGGVLPRCGRRWRERHGSDMTGTHAADHGKDAIRLVIAISVP